MCKNRTEEDIARYGNMKIQTKKVVPNSMSKKAEKELTKLNKKSNNIYTSMRFMKKDGQRY